MAGGCSVASTFREDVSVVLSGMGSLSFRDLDELYVYEREALLAIMNDRAKAMEESQKQAEKQGTGT